MNILRQTRDMGSYFSDGAHAASISLLHSSSIVLNGTSPECGLRPGRAQHVSGTSTWIHSRQCQLRYVLVPEHTLALYASHWAFTSASSQLSEHLLTTLGLHRRVGKSIAGSVSFRK